MPPALNPSSRNPLILVCCTEARTNVRRQAPPGTEIEIGVGHEHQLGLASRIVVYTGPPVVRTLSEPWKVALPRYSPLKSVRNQSLNL